MDLTPYQIDVYTGKICPYCKCKTKVSTEETVYGRRYKGRSIIICGNYPYCDAYVGTHDNSEPLGRLAKSTLRQYKKATHNLFDKLWKEQGVDRNECYLWLGNKLDIPLEYCHIGMFSENTCKVIIDIFKTKPINDIISEIEFIVNEYKSMGSYE